MKTQNVFLYGIYGLLSAATVHVQDHINPNIVFILAMIWAMGIYIAIVQKELLAIRNKLISNGRSTPGPVLQNDVAIKK